MNRDRKRITIIGGGIVGLSCAWKLTRKFPNACITVIEKETEVGLHQSGRNSGVLHCGLSYKPGSFKANLAVNGIRLMIDFCRRYEIDHDICGKVVVATNASQIATLNKLANQGKANGLKGLQLLTAEQLNKREPYVRATKALLVPEEGIVNYKAVMKKLSDLIRENNGIILFNKQVSKIQYKGNKIIIFSGNDEIASDYIINATGLFTDRVYKLATSKKRPFRIIPFRGEYKILTPEASHLFNHLIYPVPDPLFPFLGVHFTRMIDGSKEVGPNAVLALKREGYSLKDVSFNDCVDTFTYTGFYKFLGKHFRYAIQELKTSLFTTYFLKKAQELIPELQLNMLQSGSAGVRAQAMHSDGKLEMDFVIHSTKNQLHILNAPSPAATASLAIADHVISKIEL